MRRSSRPSRPSRPAVPRPAFSTKAKAKLQEKLQEKLQARMQERAAELGFGYPTSRGSTFTRLIPAARPLPASAPTTVRKNPEDPGLGYLVAAGISTVSSFIFGKKYGGPGYIIGFFVPAALAAGIGMMARAGREP